MKKCWRLISDLIVFSVLLFVFSACGGGGGGDGSPAASTAAAVTAETDSVSTADTADTTPSVPSVTAETGTLVREESFTQPIVSIAKKVDILIVMDSSASLDDERAELAAAVPEILDELDALDSYTLGMILGWGSADATVDYEGAGHLYRVGSNPYVFDSKLDSKDDISLGISETIATPPPKDNTGEAGLYSLYQFLTVYSDEAYERGFFSEDAAFVAIFMSDENDICADYPEGITPVRDPEGEELAAFELYCKDTNGNRTITAATVYQAAKEYVTGPPVRFAGLVYTGPFVPEGGENEIGYGLLEAVSISGGIAIDLAAPDFVLLAKNLGNSINALAADLKVRFPLSYGPVNTLSIQVDVDGQSQEFVYDEAAGEVILNYPGEPGSVIDITYRVLN